MKRYIYWLLLGLLLLGMGTLKYFSPESLEQKFTKKFATYSNYDTQPLKEKLFGTLETTEETKEEASEESLYKDTDIKELITHIKKYKMLPNNYITKNEARKLGWDASKGNLTEVAPGKSIGGDIFSNREGLLPTAENRVWREADINYKGGTRGAERLLYSSDNLFYITRDHYKTVKKVE